MPGGAANCLAALYSSVLAACGAQRCIGRSIESWELVIDRSRGVPGNRGVAENGTAFGFCVLTCPSVRLKWGVCVLFSLLPQLFGACGGRAAPHHGIVPCQNAQDSESGLKLIRWFKKLS